MTHQQPGPIPEHMLAREIFAAVGGIVELGAVHAINGVALDQLSVGSFCMSRQDILDELLLTVRAVGEFDSASMAIFDELGWRRDHEVGWANLALWSGAIEAYSPAIGEPPAVRRMVRMGGDLQLTNLLHALVTAAIVRGPAATRTAPLISRILSLAAELLGRPPSESRTDTFRTWRVVYLPDILKPDSKAPAAGKSAFRAHAHALEDLRLCR
ncbi:hypothetical protein [Streptomyces sp. A5-4]|uniref:hypothetical protein n=1 Tax=Streptomyces sp. A5-4 TaxID=3384771 RepID=UPI003DA94A2E